MQVPAQLLFGLTRCPIAAMTETSHPYELLTPDLMLTAVEAQGLVCDGRLLALNSYENRVYQIGIEAAAPVVVKFYRPGRWSNEAILEEHAYTIELAEAEVPVVAPWVNDAGQTLYEYGGFRFAIYPRRGGRWPELDSSENLKWIGRFIGRIHSIGGATAFKQRPDLDVQSFGWEPFGFLMESHFIPQDLQLPYRSLVEDVLKQVDGIFNGFGAFSRIRLHGDCHPGNILWTDDGPHFVDFDDARMGPAVQDLWMLLSGNHEEMSTQLQAIVEGYDTFNRFDVRQLLLIEPLRSLRMINYSAWLARRWEDPSFPRNFPWFEGPRYWEEQILALREQAAALSEPPLEIV